MTQPEVPLWDFLDRLGLPFREPMGDLVARHGTKADVWTDSHRLCLLP